MTKCRLHSIRAGKAFFFGAHDNMQSQEHESTCAFSTSIATPEKKKCVSPIESFCLNMHIRAHTCMHRKANASPQTFLILIASPEIPTPVFLMEGSARICMRENTTHVKTLKDAIPYPPYATHMQLPRFQRPILPRGTCITGHTIHVKHPPDQSKN